MRDNGWKVKVLFVVAVIVGVLLAFLAVSFLPDAYVKFKGLVFFITLALVAVLIIILGVKVFKIGQ